MSKRTNAITLPQQNCPFVLPTYPTFAHKQWVRPRFIQSNFRLLQPGNWPLSLWPPESTGRSRKIWSTWNALHTASLPILLCGRWWTCSLTEFFTGCPLCTAGTRGLCVFHWGFFHWYLKLCCVSERLHCFNLNFSPFMQIWSSWSVWTVKDLFLTCKLIATLLSWGCYERINTQLINRSS